jgi:error-prone DNA polymerase
MYIELHARSAFSFLEGASVPEELAEACHAYQMPAMALLDRDGVYGSARFHLAMKKLGLQAHIGAEVTSLLPPVAPSDNVSFPRVALLCASREGYQNLSRLITRTKLRAPKYPAKLPLQPKRAETEELLPQTQAIATTAELAEFSKGLICITGGDEGPFAYALAHSGLEEARRALEQLISIYGHENVYVELQRHYNRAQESRNQAAIELARSLKLPLLATQGAQYAKPEERQILDIFTCIRHHCHLDNAGRLLARNSERYIKSPQQMLRLFADLPEAIVNTLELSSRLEFTLNDLGYKFPPYPAPPGETMSSFLRKRTYEGASERYQRPGQNELWQRARRQIERELKLIEKLELEGYFLIVWDIVRYCRDHDILVQGRGSAANSAVCYSLGITAVDPIRMELLFERFLSEERGEWPDIDLDLPSGDQREQAIQYVYERYGKLGAAMTASVITYRGRSAAREVGKVLGFDEETLARLASLVSSWEYKDPGDTLARQFRDAGFDLQQPRIRKFFELCVAIQDLPRHLGQHSGGMVICQGQLDSVVPLEPATMPGRVVVQWDKEDCADMGIIKVDLLGLGMLAAVKDSLTLIRDNYKEDVDLALLPSDDPAVYSTLQKADTVGMFQIESRAQMSCLPRLHPTHFYDIVVQVAIVRPGPIVGKMVNPYLSRRQGREPVVYPHPSLEPVLERTLGVPLFQEQLLRMAMIAAGFTGGEAEELRRAMGFKRSEKRMRDIEVKLREGMERNGISREAQEEIVQSIISFALYGFPESHAASFALIAYASAYLKCHYLAAFTAALLNNQPMGFYSPATIVKDAQRHGLRVKPVDINCSDWLCTLEREGFVSGHDFKPALSLSKGADETSYSCPPERASTHEGYAFSTDFEAAPLVEQVFRPASLWDNNACGHSLLGVILSEDPERSEGDESKDPYPSEKVVSAMPADSATPMGSATPTSSAMPMSSANPTKEIVFAQTMYQGTTSVVPLSPSYPPEPALAGKGSVFPLLECHPERSESATADSRSRSRGVLRAFEPAAETLSEVAAATESKGIPFVPMMLQECDVRDASPRSFALRLGFRYAKGLSEEVGQAIVRARNQQPFDSIADLAHRVPELRRDHLVLLASIGALNSIGCATAKEAQTKLKNQRLHRRDALWQVERAARFAGPLLDGIPETDTASPLAMMSAEERLVADFHGTGLTTGPHPMAYRRQALNRAKVLSGQELTRIVNGQRVKTAGCVIARQRPGTAKGFVFLSLEDETGISNAIITPDLMERYRVLVTSEKFLILEGILQNQDGVISVRVERLAPLREIYPIDGVDVTDAEVRSHDFH